MRTVFQTAGLFTVLLVIYTIYLQAFLEAVLHAPPPETPSQIMWPLAKFCLMSGAPFAVMGFANPDWKSANATPVALAAWVVVFWFVSRKYGTACPLTFALNFVPLMVSARVAHKIGRRQSARLSRP